MFRGWFVKKTPAQQAGEKAGQAWKSILSSSHLDLDDFEIKEAYTHAQEQATQWLQGYVAAQSITIDGQINLSKVNVYEMRLEYVESFLKEFEQTKD